MTKRDILMILRQVQASIRRISSQDDPKAADLFRATTPIDFLAGWIEADIEDEAGQDRPQEGQG